MKLNGNAIPISLVVFKFGWRVIFNTDDGQLNIDNGSNWTTSLII